MSEIIYGTALSGGRNDRDLGSLGWSTSRKGRHTSVRRSGWTGVCPSPEQWNPAPTRRDTRAHRHARRQPQKAKQSTVKLRTKVTRGAGSPAAALTMVFKLVESAQARWRAITGAHLVLLVRTGSVFENGILVEREERVA